MKMSEKLKLIESILDDFYPSGNLEMKLYNDLRLALDGHEPEKVEPMKHKCIYIQGVCECGFMVEDHEKNYGTPKYTAEGVEVGSELYRKIYE